MVVCGGNCFGFFVNFKKAIIILFIVSPKKPFDDIPQRRIQFLRFLADIPGRQFYFIRQFFGKGSKQNILSGRYRAFVFSFILHQRLFVILFYLLFCADTLRGLRKAGIQTIGKAADDLIGNPEYTVCYQHSFIHQFQLPHVCKVMFIDKS